MNTTNDPISDMLTRIRNACAAEHRYVEMRWSKMKESIARILKEQGYVSDYKVKKDGSIGVLRVMLKYTKDRRPVIHGLKRSSRPGRRYYVGKDQIQPVLGGMGISILSTSKGILAGHQAMKQGTGGELLCKVW